MEFRGTNFSWGSGAWAGQPDVVPETLDDSAPASVNDKPKVVRDKSSENSQDGVVGKEGKADVARAPLTLRAPKLTVQPGEFVGVAGEVRTVNFTCHATSKLQGQSSTVESCFKKQCCTPEGQQMCTDRLCPGCRHGCLPTIHARELTCSNAWTSHACKVYVSHDYA